MREQIEGARALLKTPPARKLFATGLVGGIYGVVENEAEEISLSAGLDWGSLAGAWLTEWERTGDPKMRDRLLAGMRSIGQHPNGFFTAESVLNINTYAFVVADHNRMAVSHLSTAFGLIEVCAELNQLLDVPEFRKAWLDYCELYNAPNELKQQRLGQGHARLTAYAAKHNSDPQLALRAWSEFKGGSGPDASAMGIPTIQLVSGPDVLRPVEEAQGLGTNGTNQWSLAAIQCMALVGDSL